MTLQANLQLLITAFGGDVGDFQNKLGDLGLLTTTEKTSIVAAINETQAAIAPAQASVSNFIDDTAGEGDTTHAYSVDKIYEALNALRAEILGGVGSAYDTLSEIALYLESNTTTLAALEAMLENRVRYDATQTKTEEEQLQACENIGIGDPTVRVQDLYWIAVDTNTYIEPGYVMPGYVA